MKVLVNELSYCLRKNKSNWSSAIRGNGSHAEFLDLTSQPDTCLVQLQYIVRFSKKRPLIYILLAFIDLKRYIQCSVSTDNSLKRQATSYIRRRTLPFLLLLFYY